MTSTSDPAAIRRSLLAALEFEPRVNLHRDAIEVEFDDGIATLSGEVADVAAKRLALEVVAAVPAVSGIVDRLHTKPRARMGDGEIADHILLSLLEEPAFRDVSIAHRVRGERVVDRPVPAEGPGHQLELTVADGIVTLDGDVASLSHKRLAGVLAWWVPGSRDVVNGLGVEPPEEDNEGEILDALRLVLDKDPLVDATKVSASCADAVITLRGVVATEAQRRFVEADAWYLFGVDDVVNEIEALTR